MNGILKAIGNFFADLFDKNKSQTAAIVSPTPETPLPTSKGSFFGITYNIYPQAPLGSGIPPVSFALALFDPLLLRIQSFILGVASAKGVVSNLIVSGLSRLLSGIISNDGGIGSALAKTVLTVVQRVVNAAPIANLLYPGYELRLPALRLNADGGLLGVDYSKLTQSQLQALSPLQVWRPRVTGPFGKITILPERGLHVDWLSAEQVQVLSGAVMQALHPWQLNGLGTSVKMTSNSSQWLRNSAYMNGYQISQIRASYTSNLSANFIKNLTVTDCTLLNPTTLAAIHSTYEFVGVFSSGRVGANGGILRNLIDTVLLKPIWNFLWDTMPEGVRGVLDTIRNVTNTVIDWVTLKPLYEFLHSIEVGAQFNGFTGAQVSYFGKEQMSALTTNQIKYMTPQQFKILTPKQLGYLSTAQAWEMKNDNGSQLSAAQLSALKL
jgi:hypothetical protein